ncbi:helix-turn-helix domain-containing protein [Nocardia salmonicida]|uniref:PucR family transcriptional regulator n=1 Tax=Nocardia salmonicida TaxID=53431 RepID=UPI0033DB2803
MSASSLEQSSDFDELRELLSDYVTGIDERVDRLVAQLRVQVPEYAVLASSDIAFFTAPILRAVLEHVSVTFTAPAACRISAVRELARRRMRQGFPLETLTRSIQLVARFVLASLDEEASRRGLAPRVVLRAHDAAWEFANDAAGVIAEIQHGMMAEGPRENAGQRVQFLRALLGGHLSTRRLATDAGAFGVDLATLYQPLRARPDDVDDLPALMAVVARTSATRERRPVLAVAEGELFGVVPRPPVVEDRWLVALTEPAPLTAMASSFDEATTTLRLAQVFGRRGVVTLADLGPYPLAMLGTGDVERLERRHCAVLDDGRAGRRDMEDTVWAFLEHDRNTDATAAALIVHRNTVRYRLSRFQELTRLDLAHTHDLMTVWWVLAHRRLRRSSPIGSEGR